MRNNPTDASATHEASSGYSMVRQQGGQIDQSVSDPLDGVVAQINRVVHRRGLQTAVEIATIVVDAFFDGDIANFRTASGKNIDFQRLCEREDLELSYHQLWTAVSVAAQLDELPDEVGQALSVSHHRALLSVSDAQARLQLATTAAEQGWSRRQLLDEVAAWRSDRPRNGAGRPALPGFVKAVRQAVRVAQKVREAEPAPDDVRAWGLKRTEAVLSELQAEIDELSAWQERLREAAAEVRAAGPGGRKALPDTSSS